MSLVALSACQRKQAALSPKSETFEPAKENVQSQLTLPLQFEIKALPEPHRYQVELQWHGGASQAEGWQLTREDSQMESKSLISGEEGLREWVDREVEDGRSYRYLLWKNSKDGLVLHSLVTVKIPKDTVIEDTREVAALEGQGRLFLGSKAHLKPSASLSLSFPEIHSDGAIIEGRGLPVSIRARKATGKLTLDIRGQNGAAGKDGKEGSPGQRGRDGQNATTNRTCLAPNCQTVGGYPAQSLGRQDEIDAYYQFAETHWPKESSAYRSLWRCSRSASVGENGETGGQGENGTSGTNGEDSSTLFLEIADTQGLKIQIEKAFSQGGRGGAGGQGGAGGPGGKSGQNEARNICPPLSPRDGNAGSRGTTGRRGEDGFPGKIAPQCIRLNGVEEGDCETWEADVKR